MRLLVVTSVAAERDAIAAACGDRLHALIVSGVGPAASAAATSAALADRGADLVLCAGVGGGFAPLEPGAVAVSSMIAFADLGAETAEGFAPISTLGLGSERDEVPAKLAVELAERTGGHLGTILTVATVTGTAATAAQLRERFPDAVAEGMEGAGAAAAARLHGVAAAEIRAISNQVGPRDRNAWQMPEALAALGRAIADLAGEQ